MASILLSTIGSTVGSGIAGSLGASIGQLAGSFLGREVDQYAFSQNKTINTMGYKLQDLRVQTSVYGKCIPIIYGRVRIAGNIIWATDIVEIPSNRSYNTGGKGSGKVKHQRTEYIYKISLAIAIAEGEVQNLAKIWANGKELDLSDYKIKFYQGTEDQLPDPLIESHYGIGKTPAYRGISYIVFDDLHLSEFNNHIPNFEFEIIKKNPFINDKDRVENMVNAINIIPGGGEFVYDTIKQSKLKGDYIADNEFVQRGPREPINYHNYQNKANAIIALDQLQETLPNLKWVAPVVSWLCTDTNISKANILPGVEYKFGTITTPDIWQVAEFDRQSAHLIKQKDKKPIYGGTVNDTSILRYLKECRRRGLKIMFYPMIFVDEYDKPWRGKITGNVEQIKDFFNKPQGYNSFILHYANLVKDYVDAFIIGSEMIGLTSICDDNNKFPAIVELIKLAEQVKLIVGNNTKVTYAADWSEYHHTKDGWYNMDDLWASNAIDFIGIDAYFPLTEGDIKNYQYDKVIDGWNRGEGYDYYLQDGDKKPLAKEYAWKNIAYWWENNHINPDGKATKWQPKSKKIWFTEYGFPSVDCATNQPNIFYDDVSSESGLPKNSLGKIDNMAQRMGIYATEKRWYNSDMIENKFLWTWDARPYPYWPDLKYIWNDGNNWHKGHWVQGKLGITMLSDVIRDLAAKCDVKLDNLKLLHPMEGMVINHPNNVANIIEKLRTCYMFDSFEDGNNIYFSTRNKVYRITYDDIIFNKEGTLSLSKINENMLPKKVNINYIDRYAKYNIGNITAINNGADSNQQLNIDLPIVINSQNAKHIADTTLYKAWSEQYQYSFYLPCKYLYLHPSDIVTIDIADKTHFIKIITMELCSARIIKVTGISTDINLTNNCDNTQIHDAVTTSDKLSVQPLTYCRIIDPPLLPYETPSNGRVFIAACALSHTWQGCSISSNIYGNDQEVAFIAKPSLIGTVLNVLSKNATSCLIDRKSKIIVNMLSSNLENTDDDGILNYNNMALIGNEVIQFKYAKLIDDNKYELSYLMRGCRGTEQHIADHKKGEQFILLDKSLLQNNVNIPNKYKNYRFNCHVSTLGNEKDVNNIEYHYKANLSLIMTPVYINIHIIKNTNRTIIISWFKRSFDKSLLLNQLFLVKLFKKDVEIYNAKTTETKLVIDNIDIDIDDKVYTHIIPIIAFETINIHKEFISS